MTLQAAIVSSREYLEALRSNTLTKGGGDSPAMAEMSKVLCAVEESDRRGDRRQKRMDIAVLVCIAMFLATVIVRAMK